MECSLKCMTTSDLFEGDDRNKIARKAGFELTQPATYVPPTTDEPAYTDVEDNLTCLFMCVETRMCRSMTYVESTRACYLGDRVNQKYTYSKPMGLPYIK